MNKKITLYELLGLIKDGKAPKKIKYDNYEWTYNSESSAYWNGKGIEFEDYMEDSLIACLNDDVEILDDEDMEIEELPNIFSNKQKKLANKINELVREINKLKKEK